MEYLKHLVTPEPASPFVYYLECKEKNYKFCVVKMFENDFEAHYNYDFRHLDDAGNEIGTKGYKAFAGAKGITRADNMRAALWFLTKYFSFRELNYEISADGNFKKGGYYPVLGRHFERFAFDLNWE